MPWTSKRRETRLSPVEVLLAIAPRFSREARARAGSATLNPNQEPLCGNCR
jgi:hypothetical protein